MSNGKQEQEHLRRLRERQLADRDPLVKQHQFQRMSANREKKIRKPYSLGRMWRDIPYVWKGLFCGIGLGTLALIVVPLFWISHWAIHCSAVSIVVFAIFGALLGRAIDSREEIKDLIR